MLEWLKEILGDNYTEETDSKISQAIGKHFVSKADFNTKSEALKQAEEDVKTRDSQLEKLKNSNGTLQTLQQQITDLQNQNAADKKTYEDKIAEIRLNNAVEAALTAARAKNNTAVKALLSEFLKNAKVGEDGTVNGLTEKIDGLSTAEDTAFLFNKAGETKFKGVVPGSSGDGITNPGKSPKDMSYEELCSYLEQNPDAQLN